MTLRRQQWPAVSGGPLASVTQRGVRSCARCTAGSTTRSEKTGCGIRGASFELGAVGSERIVSRCENSSDSGICTTFFALVQLWRCRAEHGICARAAGCRRRPRSSDSLENLFETPHGAGKNDDQTSSGYRRFTRFRDVGFEEVRRRLPVVDVSDEPQCTACAVHPAALGTSALQRRVEMWCSRHGLCVVR